MAPKHRKPCPLCAIIPAAGFMSLIISLGIFGADYVTYGGLSQNASNPAIGYSGSDICPRSLPEVTGYDQLSSQTFRRFVRHPHLSLTTTTKDYSEALPE